MNRTDMDLAAYEDAVQTLLQYPEHVRKLGWPDQPGANGRDKTLSTLNLLLRQPSDLNAQSRSFIKRAPHFARRVNIGIAPDKAVSQAWSNTPF